MTKDNSDIEDTQSSGSSEDIEDIDDSEDNPNKDFNPVTFFNNKELCYYKMIDKYFKYCPTDQIVKMINIIDGLSEISLRVLDWVVTRYSKRHIDITTKDKENGEVFDIHISYKSQLKSFKKRYFDPFRRRKKFHYKYIVDGQEKTLYTTLGQLNFFKWAISNSIVKFVEENIAQIIKAMNLSNKEDKKKKEKKKIKAKQTKTVKVKKETVVPEKKNIITIKNNKSDVKIKATKTIEDDEVQIVLSFD